MEKLTVVTSILFLFSDLFAVIAISTPDWIIINLAGKTRLGLARLCVEFENQEQLCENPSLPAEWSACLLMICLGIILITLTLFLLAFSIWKPECLKAAKWMAFVGMMMFCLAALVFPFGFHMPEIGGEAYKLPPKTEVGSSYYLFFAALFCSTISCSLSNMYMFHLHFF